MVSKREAKNPFQVLYIHETFAVVTAGKLHIVTDLLNYGPPTHAVYRAGTIWYLRIIDTMLRDEVYAALEFTLAHDPISSFITEL